MTDWKKWFEKWGKRTVNKLFYRKPGGEFDLCEDLTIEDLYQAFEARRKAEERMAVCQCVLVKTYVGGGDEIKQCDLCREETQ